MRRASTSSLERRILALQVQHRYRRHRGAGGGERIGLEAFCTRPWYQPQRECRPTPASDGSGFCIELRHGELKRFANRYIVVTLRELAAPGIPAPSPPICIFMEVQFKLHSNLQEKQEIGTWRTSRHKTFRTPS